MNSIIKKEKLYPIITFVFILSFYLFYALYDGYFVFPDSDSYISMRITRTFFYPMFLYIVRFLCQGNDIYLLFVVIAQSILAAVCAFSLVEYLRRSLKLPKIISFILLLLPMLVSLMTRYVAGRAAMYTNSIMTEGITISLYLLLFRFLLEYINTHVNKFIIYSTIVSFIMYSTRQHMAITAVLVFLAIIYVYIKKKKIVKGLVISIVTVICIYSLSTGVDIAYNSIYRSNVAEGSGDNRFLLTMIFYTAELSDGEYIEDAKVQELFNDIYEVCDTNELTLKYATGLPLEMSHHYATHYDLIQINNMWPMIRDFAHSNYDIGPGDELELYVDEISVYMIKELLPHVVPELMIVFSNSFLTGLVTTVATENSILLFCACIAYLALIALFIYNAYNKKWNMVMEFALFSFLGIIVNVSVVASQIFCQSRYTIYNMPLFYMAGLLLLYHAFRGEEKR